MHHLAPPARRFGPLAAALLAGSVPLPTGAAAQGMADLARLSLDELAALEITSVSRRPEPLGGASASVYVITREDIRRSGAPTLPEALRLAPNLHVARIDARSYAITARGFNGIETANKLQVLADGRSLYTPFHAGVFWDEQLPMLADIDRIEVISGPGGTLWGANAVNGVINIISRAAHETQGGLVDLQFGPLDKAVSARWGGRIGRAGAFRIYGMGYGRMHQKAAPGGAARDGWDGRKGGFRTDWGTGNSGFTVQGDLYANDTDAGGEVSGRNLLGRWTYRLPGGSSLMAQTYYDRVDRSPGGDATDTEETVDGQLQHTLEPLGRHGFVWGGGYRVTRDAFRSIPSDFTVDPARSRVRLANLFAQDQFTLAAGLTLTAGLKFEHSSFSGSEFLPSIRMAWRPGDGTTLWAAVSRAARTPSRIERDLSGGGIVARSPGFDSEKLIAYEAGLRAQPLRVLTVSLALFYNHYDDLRTTEFAPGGGLPLRFGNGITGRSYGLEGWADLELAPWWRLGPAVSTLHRDYRLKAGHSDFDRLASLGVDPAWQVSLRSQMSFRGGVELDARLRAVDDLSRDDVPGYVEADFRIGWRVADNLELSVTGTNLLHASHAEIGPLTSRREIRRSVIAGTRVRF